MPRSIASGEHAARSGTARWLRDRIGSGARDDTGSASLEFVTAGLILLLPLVYLILTVATVQAAALATEGSARQAVRVFVRADTESAGRAAAERAVRVGLADFGIDADAAEVDVTCSPRPEECLRRRGSVTVSVTVAVTLPLLPTALDVDAPASIPLSGTATHVVSRFWAGAS
ncbi:hypothetical protein [Planctomonas psychrotolerans]|uniref:hypothetical protein n=1 Tax=Planctomonas psychrotolerans TaxID=2528712 RepID=UPI001D0D596A|nr:hypothetical protein [Planctomonas psychrotolerans]